MEEQNNLSLGHFLGLFMAGGAGVCLRAILIPALNQALSSYLANIGLTIVNLLGCLAIGLLAVWIANEPLRDILLVGFLGGFTTYSTFALVLSELWTSARWFVLIAQLFLHVGGGIFCVVAGLWLGRNLS